MEPMWAPDPFGRHGRRYWDGQRWTDHVLDGDTPGIDPLRPAATSATSPSKNRPARWPLAVVGAVVLVVLVMVAGVGAQRGRGHAPVAISPAARSTASVQPVAGGLAAAASPSGSVQVARPTAVRPAASRAAVAPTSSAVTPKALPTPSRSSTTAVTRTSTSTATSTRTATATSSRTATSTSSRTATSTRTTTRTSTSTQTSTSTRTSTSAAPGGSVYYANCAAARAAGAAPLHRGEPGYRPALDRDGDGVACE